MVHNLKNFEISIEWINKTMLTINLVNCQYMKISKKNPNDIMVDLDATALYPSAIWDQNGVYPKIESGVAFKLLMNDIYVEAFNIQTFNQDGNESAILRIKFYNAPDLIFQHLPVKEKVKNKEVNRMRKRYNLDTFTSADIQKIVKIRGKVIEIYEAVIYRENFKISPFRKLIEKLLALRQKIKDKSNDLMQVLVNLFMNSLYGVQIRKHVVEFYKSKSEHWMETEYDENVLDYWRLPNGNCIVKLKKTLV